MPKYIVAYWDEDEETWKVHYWCSALREALEAAKEAPSHHKVVIYEAKRVMR